MGPGGVSGGAGTSERLEIRPQVRVGQEMVVGCSGVLAWDPLPPANQHVGQGRGGLSRVDRILKLVQYHENQGVWTKPGTSLLECTCLVTVSGHWP